MGSYERFLEYMEDRISTQDMNEFKRRISQLESASEIWKEEKEFYDYHFESRDRAKLAYYRGTEKQIKTRLDNFHKAWVSEARKGEIGELNEITIRRLELTRPIKGKRKTSERTEKLLTPFKPRVLKELETKIVDGRVETFEPKQDKETFVNQRNFINTWNNRFKQLETKINISKGKDNQQLINELLGIQEQFKEYSRRPGRNSEVVNEEVLGNWNRKVNELIKKVDGRRKSVRPIIIPIDDLFRKPRTKKEIEKEKEYGEYPELKPTKKIGTIISSNLKIVRQLAGNEVKDKSLSLKSAYFKEFVNDVLSMHPDLNRKQAELEATRQLAAHYSKVDKKNPYAVIPEHDIAQSFAKDKYGDPKQILNAHDWYEISQMPLKEFKTGFGRYSKLNVGEFSPFKKEIKREFSAAIQEEKFKERLMGTPPRIKGGKTYFNPEEYEKYLKTPEPEMGVFKPIWKRRGP